MEAPFENTLQEELTLSKSFGAYFKRKAQTQTGAPAPFVVFGHKLD